MSDLFKKYIDEMYREMSRNLYTYQFPKYFQFPRPAVVKPVPAPVDPAVRHASLTANLGARHGERTADYRVGRDHPETLAASAAWSAHLRFLVNQSAQADKERAPSVGWDPYGDD